MNVELLRFLDRFIALPLCWACTFVRWLARLIRARRPLPAPRNVLIIKLSEMGSTVIAYPAIMELKQRCPQAQLFFLVFKNNAAIFEPLNLVPSSHVITVDVSSVFRFLTTGLRAIRFLVEQRIDTTVDMDFFSRFTVLLSFLVCRGNRVGFHRYSDEGPCRGNLLTHRVFYSPHVHTAVAFMALIRTLFEKPDDEPHYRGRIPLEELVPPRYVPPAHDVIRVQDKLRSAGIVDGGSQMLILINPNSSDIFPLRRWPMENFAQLCGCILETMPSCWLIITGVASEQKDARYIRERVQSPRCIDFTGKTTIHELLALYSIATLMVTNDSGPAHFASLLELPTIVLFGPETPRLYSPLGKRHRDVYAEFACSPCVSVYNGKKSLCTDNRCLKTLGVDHIVKEVLALMRG